MSLYYYWKLIFLVLLMKERSFVFNKKINELLTFLYLHLSLYNI